MNKAIQYREDGKFYGLVNWSNEPVYSNYVKHTHYYWQVNKFERAKRDYDKSLQSAGKEIINPEVLPVVKMETQKGYSYLNGKGVKPLAHGDIFDCPDNIEFEEQVTCLEKCDGECGECGKLQVVIRLKLKHEVKKKSLSLIGSEILNELDEVKPVESQDELISSLMKLIDSHFEWREGEIFQYRDTDLKTAIKHEFTIQRNKNGNG